ncbi:AbrB/MazE/SpoVT family DNA-binding domain-containing protein [Huintestinicola sp.]|uniref:AbrB/MazE/SpoVT family DNA-binding domain-containing protein n=1 Tax=Huintestinicola sp. TaxID=2981661 RepID=UPI003D7F0C47
MKSSAITRQLDALGRVVIPIEMRRNLNIENRDSVEIYAEDDRIIIKKAGESCVFCGSAENLLIFKDRCVCSECLAQLKQ